MMRFFLSNDNHLCNLVVFQVTDRQLHDEPATEEDVNYTTKVEKHSDEGNEDEVGMKDVMVELFQSKDKERGKAYVLFIRDFH